MTLGGVAVAFALAFGLGGREPAERLLSKLLDTAESEGKKPNPLANQPKTSSFGGTPSTGAANSDAKVDLPSDLTDIDMHPDTDK